MLAAGRRLFHLPRQEISADRLACQTCHPDGRQDGQVWAGLAGRLQTPILAGRLARTGPYHWHGEARTLEDSIRETVRRLGGIGLGGYDIRRLARFLRDGLPPVPRPSRGPEAARGAALFEVLECTSCHDHGLAYQNGAAYALIDRERIDVPSLRHLRLGAPYLHDGRAADLDAVLESGAMGPRARSLPRADRAALIAFLRTL